ncbi:Serine hydroxymethyltransferase, cytosolic [Perkinsus chesapeaki]|uniref:Serine hydroxymethyltransferase n=1 Tax=Perkinsus chesapeaki TaxID=330153 RepID=A0A7J6LMX3_PERCH|nr:Serine hydroxymethyltransferase, cytosolic [Perkinsus chesapeaki]
MSVELMNTHLKEADPTVFDIIEHEKERQRTNVCLIASENFTSQAVLDAIGSIMTNKYSEGYPGARYYGGNEFIDQMENLCMDRALETFRLDPAKWGVNVQTLSGSPANLAVYTALIDVHDRIMALDLPHGGHLSHGYQTDTKKVSMISKFYTCMPYRLDEKTGLIDYDELEKFAQRFRPKILICGYSAYPRHFDFVRLRAIADSVGAILHCDMAHVAGLVAAGVHPSPFDLCDIVTTTSHKTLRGPRGAMIFYRVGQKGVDKAGNPIMYDYKDKINATVFPGLQGGPHNHIIAGLAVALKQAQTEEYRQYQEQVVKNSKALADELIKLGYDLVSGGTDNHLVLLDLRSKGINGNKTEKVCDHVAVSLNKNTVPGDKSAITPSGLRIGAPAMTTRGAKEDDFRKIAQFIDRVVKIGLEVQKQSGPKLKDFLAVLDNSPPEALSQLKEEVVTFSRGFTPIGQ